MTIQSSSPRTSLARRAGSERRWAASPASDSFDSVSRVLGLGGSSYLIMRSISKIAASFNWARLIGVVPVSNSYSSTPRA